MTYDIDNWPFSLIDWLWFNDSGIPTRERLWQVLPKLDENTAWLFACTCATDALWTAIEAPDTRSESAIDVAQLHAIFGGEIVDDDLYEAWLDARAAVRRTPAILHEQLAARAAARVAEIKPYEQPWMVAWSVSRMSAQAIALATTPIEMSDQERAEKWANIWTKQADALVELIEAE